MWFTIIIKQLSRTRDERVCMRWIDALPHLVDARVVRVSYDELINAAVVNIVREGDGE